MLSTEVEVNKLSNFASQKYVWKPSFKPTNFPWLQLKKSLSVLLQDCHFAAAI